MAQHKRGLKTRLRLIEAAAELIETHGVKAFTLERVAAHAGVSKGGLLYHFRTKEALLQAMLDDGSARFTEALMQRLNDEPEAPGRMARAYLRASFDTLELKSLAQGLFAAAALEPALLEPAKQSSKAWYELLTNDGLPPTRATLVCCMADGLWSGLIIGTLPTDPETIEALLEEALALTRP